MLSSYIELDWMMMIMVHLMSVVQVVDEGATLIEGVRCTIWKIRGV